MSIDQATVYSSSQRLEEIKDEFPALAVDQETAQIEGVVTEASYWRARAIHGKTASLSKALNHRFQVIKDVTEGLQIEGPVIDYYILEDEKKHYHVLNREQLNERSLESQLRSVTGMNRLLTDEVNTLQEKVKEYEQVIHTSYDEIFVTDGEGNVLLVSESCLRMTGLSKERFIGKNIFELTEQGIINNSVTIDVLQQKKMITKNQEYPNKVKVVATGIPLFNHDGTIHRVITNSRDITELTNLQHQLAEAKSILEEKERKKFALEPFFTLNEPTIEVVQTAVNVALTDSSILIQGESGVGKGVLANLIHSKSTRSSGPFIHVNCGAIPPQLLEAELFGYEAGAFTGAHSKGKQGLVEAADGGTLFLDEIGELPLDLQVKILNLVQHHSFRKVGSNQYKNVDIRIISATNKDLRSELEKGLFREDLYYRLHVVPLNIPPLRERREDIPFLVDLFLEKFNKKYKKRIILAETSITKLISYHWPGNVRELENMMEQLVVTARTAVVFADALPPHIKTGHQNPQILIRGILPLKEAVESVERQLLYTALDQFKTSRKIAAALEVNQTTVIRKLHKYDLKLTSKSLRTTY